MCASIENAVRKKGNLSKINSNTWIPIMTSRVRAWKWGIGMYIYESLERSFCEL